MVSSELVRIEEKIICAINRYNMLENIHNVIIGVSGGADSMALLRFFEAYAIKSNLKIIAAHVNHCLRGEESDRDETFVRRYCEKNGIQLAVLNVDVNAAARREGLGIEECARKIRYEFFESLATKYEGCIATAHTLSDSIETALINLSRGTGPAGLCGIPAKRDNIIRPLILLKRAETQLYCELNGIAYITDSTNLMPEYTRNKVRLEIMPLFRQINPEFEDNVARTTSLLRSDDDYLNEVAWKVVEESFISRGVFDLEKIKAQPLPILSRIIRLIVFEFVKYNVSAHHIQLILNIIKSSTGAVMLPRKVKVCVEGNILTVQTEVTSPEVLPSEFECAFAPGVLLTDTGEKFIIKMLERAQLKNFLAEHKLQFYYVLDYAKISPEVKFRYRRSGDKFSQAGRGVTKTIKKLFNELKMPVSTRDKVLILADKNEVLWIDNVGVSQDAQVNEDTKNVVLIYSEEKSKC